MVAVLDDEDADLIGGPKWRAWFNNGRVRRWMVARDECRFGRKFRVFLHREVGARLCIGAIRPHRMSVCALNLDYLDCRRENLYVLERRETGRRKAPHFKPIGQPVL